MFWQNKHREASEQAFFLFIIIWRCLAEALGTYGLDMIPGTRFPGGTEATGAWRRFFWFLSLHSLAMVRLPFNTFFFLVKTTWHQPALEDGPGFLGDGVQTKGTTRRLGHGGNGRLMMTRPAHNNTHTHKIDWRVRRHRGRGLRNMIPQLCYYNVYHLMIRGNR